MEDRTMEKLFVMTLVLVMVGLGGILHGGYIHHEISEEVVMSYENRINYPESMPQVIINPTPISYL
jgi:hypothetical protein